MEKLNETLIILNHFAGVIEGRTNYCKRNINFNISDCATQGIQEKFKINQNPYATPEILTEISRNCVDQKIILHSYISLNFIDMFSFNDEYTKYFNSANFDDNKLKTRILKVLKNNSIIRKKIDWELIRKFRNNVLARNLRDNQNNFKLSISTLKELSEFLNNLKASIEYCEVISEIYANIEIEFKTEILEFKSELIKKYRSN